MQHHSDDSLLNEIDSLQRPLVGRRVLSWLLFMLILVGSLGLPIVASVWPSAFGTPAVPVGHGVPVHGTQAKAERQATALALDVQWSAGKLASAHQGLAKDCKACHSKPFERVQDRDCLACHRDIGEHVSAKTVSMPALHETRCATCHRDHQGADGLTAQNRRYIGIDCVACHADIKRSAASTKVADVKDFASGHPAFRVQLAVPATTPAAGATLVRVRQGAAALSQPSTLKFPHDVHLVPDGIAGPGGKKALECASCHRPTPSGAGFEPVTMKRDCQSCHALAFEPALSQRQVPHGSVDEVLSTLREFYSYVGSSKVALDRAPANSPIFTVRPGAHPLPVASFVQGAGDARAHAAAAAVELFEKTSCIVCHSVTRSAGPGKAGTPGFDLPQWKIAAVAPSHVWLPKAAFDHQRHRVAPCADCHAAAKSAKSSDVLIPAIKVCHDCHSGAEPVVGKVKSDCAMCHGFHLPGRHQAVAQGAVAHPVKQVRP